MADGADETVVHVTLRRNTVVKAAPQLARPLKTSTVPFLFTCVVYTTMFSGSRTGSYAFSSLYSEVQRKRFRCSSSTLQETIITCVDGFVRT